MRLWQGKKYVDIIFFFWCMLLIPCRTGNNSQSHRFEEQWCRSLCPALMSSHPPVSNLIYLSDQTSYHNQSHVTNHLPSNPNLPDTCIEVFSLGQPRWLSGLAPLSVQGLILETRDRVPRWLPAWSLLLLLPMSLPLSLSLSLISK